MAFNGAGELVLKMEVKVNAFNNIEIKGFDGIATIEPVDDPMIEVQEEIDRMATLIAEKEAEVLGKPLPKPVVSEKAAEKVRPTLAVSEMLCVAEEAKEVELSGGEEGTHYYKVTCGNSSITFPITL